MSLGELDEAAEDILSTIHIYDPKTEERLLAHRKIWQFKNNHKAKCDLNFSGVQLFRDL